MRLLRCAERVTPQKNPISYPCHRYTAQSACQHYERVIPHERLCLALNPDVRYACEIIVSPDKLAIGDPIILHSLGV